MNRRITGFYTGVRLSGGVDNRVPAAEVTLTIVLSGPLSRSLFGKSWAQLEGALSVHGWRSGASDV